MVLVDSNDPFRNNPYKGSQMTLVLTKYQVVGSNTNLDISSLMIYSACSTLFAGVCGSLGHVQFNIQCISIYSSGNESRDTLIATGNQVGGVTGGELHQLQCCIHVLNF